MFEQCAYVLQESIFSDIPINVLYHLLDFFMCAALFRWHRTCIILCPPGLVSLLEFEEHSVLFCSSVNAENGLLLLRRRTFLFDCLGLHKTENMDFQVIYNSYFEKTRI